MDLQDPNPQKPGDSGMKAAAVAWTLPFTLVVPMVIGGAAGYFLDRWLHSKPAFMIILGLLGLVVGVRDVIKTASKLDK